jgi:hypothetical protein
MYLRGVKCLVLLALVAATAAAEPRQKLAISIEGKELETAKTAEAFTAALRKRASAKTGRYELSGSAKDMTAAIRGAECLPTETKCAVKLGAALAVDYVLVGQIETRAKHRVIVIGMVNVQTRQRVRSLRDTVATTTDTKAWARKVYDRMIDADAGELTVIANAQRGEVMLDGEVVGALFSGRVTLLGVAIGTHQLGIRAPGYRPLDTEITVDGKTKETVLLEPAP